MSMFNQINQEEYVNQDVPFAISHMEIRYYKIEFQIELLHSHCLHNFDSTLPASSN